MHVILLGTAAGGGFPQWNCWCPPCRLSRLDPVRARPRTQSSAAVSADGERWFLLNASPDVRDQLGRLVRAAPTGMRHVPVAGIVTTDAELDHTLGIVLLREGRHLQLYATSAVRTILERDSRILEVTSAFALVEIQEIVPGRIQALHYLDGSPSGITIEPFVVPAGPPRFAQNDLEGHTVGLTIRDDFTGGTCAFVPGCGALDAGILARLRSADLILFDGTFWLDDELITLGIGERTARQMDHLPIAGPGGSLAVLATLGGSRRVYTHINNTNPVLIEDSAERAEVDVLGVQVGADGMRFEV